MALPLMVDPTSSHQFGYNKLLTSGALLGGYSHPLSMPEDVVIKLIVVDDDSNKPREQLLLAHRDVIGAKSAVLRAQIQANGPCCLAVCVLNLTTIPDALTSFKALLSFMYTGTLPIENQANVESLMTLANLLQVTDAENYQRQASFAAAQQMPANLIAMLSASTGSAALPTSSAAQQQSQLCNFYTQCLLQSQLASASAAVLAQMSTSSSSSSSTTTSPHSHPIGPYTMPHASTIGSNGHLKPAGSPLSDGPADASLPDGEANEQLIVSTDKEGWCRNKKYIENVPSGYRCTVCRKVYGRYNSVSYHVTIYHRNPPIRCGVEGCPFTTREARYIHFHKYYRHGIKLPDSIDLASRKCPYCRHISKSPAMLEKHIYRHVQDCLKSGTHTYACPKCGHEAEHQQHMFEHLRNHQCDVLDTGVRKRKAKTSLSQEELFGEDSLAASISQPRAPPAVLPSPMLDLATPSAAAAMQLVWQQLLASSAASTGCRMLMHHGSLSAASDSSESMDSKSSPATLTTENDSLSDA